MVALTDTVPSFYVLRKVYLNVMNVSCRPVNKHAIFPRTAGGGGVIIRPLRFFADSEKNGHA